MIAAAEPYRVLIVEDEYFIADEVAIALRRDGFDAVGPVAETAAALAALDAGNVDFAVVDINLEGTASFAVASELRARNIPFLFLTGYDASIVPAELNDVPLLRKPYDGHMVVAEVKRHRDGASLTSVNG